MLNKCIPVRRSAVNGAILWLTVLGATGTAMAQAVPKPSVTSDIEEIYVARSILESRKSPTEFCAKARTGFDNPLVEDQFIFQSIATRGSDGLIIDTNVQTIARATACFGSTSDIDLITFYAEFTLGTVTFTGRGDCRTTKQGYPEQGMKVMRCFLDLSDISGGRVGGQLTTNTMNSRKAIGDQTDPPGYTQSSIATIRLWKRR